MSGPPPGWGMPGMVPGYPAAQPYGGMYGARMYPPPGGAPMVMPGVLAPPTHKKDTKPDRREENKVQPENIYTVYIGHIAEDVEPADIDQVLGYCGTTSGWNRIGADSNPKPLGFVTYEAAFPAARLLRVLDGLQLGSSKLVVKVDPATLARIQKAEPPPGELVLQEDEQIRERCKVVVARIEERKNAVEEAKNSALSSTFMESMTNGNGEPPVLYPPPAVPPLGPPSGPPPTGPPLTGPPTGPPPTGPPLTGPPSGPPPTGFPQVPPTAPPTGPPPTAPPKGPPPSKSSKEDIGKVREEESKEDRRKRQQDKDFRSALKNYESKERHRIRDLEDRKERKIKNSERDARFVEKEREFEANYDDNASNGDSKYYRSKQIFDLKENWRFEERWMTGDRERDAAETKKDQKEETVVEKPALVSGGSSIGFGLKAQAAAKAQTASVPVAQAPTASAVTNVFNADEDEESVQVKKRKLVKITYTDDQLRAAGLDPEKERKKRVEELIASIPVEKDPLFAYKVQWVAIDEALVGSRIKPWVDRKISEFVGGPEPSLVKFICDKIVAKTKPGAILAEVEGILDDEAEMFVKKLWRLLIYETEYKKLDLNSQQ